MENLLLPMLSLDVTQGLKMESAASKFAPTWTRAPRILHMELANGLEQGQNLRYCDISASWSFLKLITGGINEQEIT